MKTIFISALFLSFGANAMLQKASIDEALSHRYDENYEETQRGVASKVEKVEDSQQDEDQRKPSSQGETFEQMNENGIRFWKY